MKAMYPAQANSPGTELGTAIDAIQDTIEVVDGSVLPDAPNLLTIGTDESAETILYNEKVGNELTGVTRGFQGTAQSWQAGTKVARYMTAYDYDTARENIEGLYDRLDDAETDLLTLQPGLQVVTAVKDARFRLGEIRGKTEINGQGRIGLVGVENPYAINTAGNLLPPFYEWTAIGLATGATYTIDEPYKMTLNDPGQQSGGVSLFYTVINVPAKTNITLKLPHDTWNTISDATGDNLLYPWEKSSVHTINTGGNNQIRVYLGNRDGAGSYVFENPLLTIGSEPKPFQPQRSSMLAFQTELHANPTDGSDPDVLIDQNGQYLKLGKWKKVVADGSLKYMFVASLEGFKVVYAPGIAANAAGQGDGDDVGSLFGTKYNGQPLTVDDSGVYAWPSADLIRISSNNIYISIANTDSGWGDDYDPSQEEIKAYFNGWRMCDGNSTQPFTEAEGEVKCWGPIANPANTHGSYPWVNTVYNNAPDYPARVSGGYEYHPYNFLYRLSKEAVVPVTAEGCLTLSEGDSVIEVGTGIVLREKNIPVTSSTAVGINIIGSINSPLKYKADKIFSIYKNSHEDKTWEIVTRTDGSAYGNQRASTGINTFDPSAAYSVTYLKLDKPPIVPITGSLAANEKAQISDLTAGVAEALQRVSVVEQKKAEKDAPGWITPTLLNGTTPYGQFVPMYFKDGFGFVHLTGQVTARGYVSIFKLPVGYRPGRKLRFYQYSYGDAPTGGEVWAEEDGTVRNSTGGLQAVSLDGISFLAEQ
ncbi:hypothetical protein [Paenibacillus woosongensis]|uniref:Tail fiber protein n=1 Tax=Paenibacillus woosongensis TaxID=307580 RepID=A0A7X2Z116_9BACL|nr:hypothetical protein [Paenibacillus woosongensis]MUG45532.1 hypothetical protein [Paenibacillus woosongensis]